MLDPPPDTAEPVTADYIDWLRHSITHLVTLDGQHGGAELAPMAARLFRTASGRLASGEYSQAIERDFAAVVAELGEVAGWLAFDALQHEQARSLNLESLHLARLAGDRDMELFLLGNMAMQAQETGRPRETLRTVQLMETFNLSPRMRIMTGIRRARAAADLGDERAFEVLHRAQSDLSSSVHRTEPSWAWWINATEVQSHEGGVWRAIGERSQAVDCYSAALESIAPRYRWGRFITGANLINALVEVADWPEAERIAAEVYTLASEVSSARAMHRIRTAADTAYRSGAPSTLEGMLTALARRTT
ncbi:tetratricopeptide (TPR) repeat protein [Saccharopolyspora phatthalungensis]|uniref:Tetratricopeptide (TPR) repeat protein n=1 Tax=Saccharopolyspora phatthalungensis TaxID=664693 RepID=A0A840PZ62_9PSEU|nr:tetratricopeptide (TPR) repeat protein [Saccharopolyspora phatthalungensis]